MHVAFNTEELSPQDRKMLAILVSGTPSQAVNDTPTAEQVVGRPAPAKKAAAKPAPAPEPEEPGDPLDGPTTGPEEEDLVGAEAPTMADAVAAATKLVSGGNAGKVKEALGAVGAKRVSEIPAESIAAFLDALK